MPLKRLNKLGWVCFIVIIIYFFIAIGVKTGLLGTGWDEVVADGYEGISTNHFFGTNLNGQDVFKRAISGTGTAFEIGIIVTFFALLIGTFLGLFAGYFVGTIIDEIIVFIYTVLDSIPFYLFVIAVAFALKNVPFSMHIAMIASFWTSTARLVRGETIKLKNMPYVESARAIGANYFRIMFKHILPNTMNIIPVQASIIFVMAIKNEVILSFLGLGVREGISWGLMIAESSGEVGVGIFNNFLSASIMLSILVLAFSLFADSIQEFFEPKSGMY